jgi:hypothetical protein
MQNPEFFESYAVRLRVKQQIGVFNELVRRQHDITGAAVPPLDRIYPMTKMSTRPDASAFNELSAILDGTSSGPVWPGPTELPPSGSVGHIPPIERLWQSYLAPISELQPPSPNPSSHTQARQGSLDGSPQPRRYVIRVSLFRSFATRKFVYFGAKASPTKNRSLEMHVINSLS